MFVNLFCNIIFYDFDLRYHQSSSSGGGKRWLHYNITSKPTPANIRERNIAVTSYYNQTAIDHAIEKVKVSSSFFETFISADPVIFGRSIFPTFILPSFQNSVRLTPATIMYSGRSHDGLHVMVRQIAK